MFRKISFLLLVLFLHQFSYAQQDSATNQAPPQPGSHLRISLITCGPGDEEVWEVFGHTAVRVVDSTNHLDLTYNYGTFEFGPNFEIQFMRGKLLYCLSVGDFQDFIPEYVNAHRSVEEQVLLLGPKQKEAIYAFLNRNAEPEHKYYKYDFFFDNCATRIRDIFPKVFGSGFVYGRTMPPGSRITFRDIINRYFYRDHWTRLGVNLLLGSRIDKPMTNEDIMFLPDYLRDGVAGATVNGNKIAAPTVLLLPGNEQPIAGINQPFILMCIIAMLTIVGLSFKQFHILGRIMSSLLLFVTGLLGILMLVMWFGTDHQGCADNFNILWCLPTNIILAFFKPKGRSRYSVIAILLLFTSLALHIFKVQGLTLLELAPLFLSLLFVYGMIYKNSKPKPTPQNA